MSKKDFPELPAVNEIQILLNEYQLLIEENRNIHKTRLTIFKLIMSSLIGLITYVFAGAFFYVRTTGLEKADIPKVVIYAFCILGVILTFSIYLFVHNTYYHVATSKKHTVRNWKAIHAIRAKFKEMYPKIADALVMQDSKNNPERPRLSERWYKGIFIFPLYNVMFYIILTLLTSPFFADFGDDGKLIEIDSGDLNIFKKGLIVWWPFLMLRLFKGFNAMKRFWLDIKKAMEMRVSNFFPEDSKQAEVTESGGGETKKRSSWFRKIVQYGQSGLVIIVISLTIISYAWPLSILGFGNEKNLFIWIGIIFGFTVIAIVGEVLYLKLYNLNFTMRVKDGTINIRFK